MVWLAHLSQDSDLLSVFQQGLDMHVHTASRIFGVPPDRVDPHTQRLPSKTLNYAVVYGTTGEGLRQQIASAGGPLWTTERTEAFIADWYGAYPGCRRWIALQHERARRYGMVWCAFGRPRLIPEVRSQLNRIRNEGLRQAGNQPIQASAQGTIKLAMAGIWPICQYYQSRGAVCWPLLQIHDELLFELDRVIAEEFLAQAKVVMEQVVHLSVPVRSSASIAERWGEL
jgi:DNA polymerase-1